MFCPKCGSENNNNNKFCKKCGTSLTSESFKTYNTAGQNNYNNQRYINSYPRQNPGGNNKNIIIAIIVTALVIIAAAAALLYVFDPFEIFTKDEVKTSSEISGERKISRRDRLNQNDKGDMNDDEAFIEEDTEETTLTMPDISTDASIYSLEIETDSGNADSNNSDYIIPYSGSRYLTEEDLADLTPWQLKLARNEIYARRGRKFLDEQLQAYFDSCSWYTGMIEPDDFNEDMFNDYEKQNKDFIRKYETERGYNN